MFEMVWHWPAERLGLRQQDCDACRKNTLHVAGYRGRVHCTHCWLRELKRLSENVGGIAVENAAARRAFLATTNQKPVHQLLMETIAVASVASAA